MLTPKITVSKFPTIKVKTGNRRLYQAIAVEAQKEIRARTEKEGRDKDGNPFKDYSRNYEEYRSYTGRSTKPNLSYSGKMLGGMQPTATRSSAKIRLSGEQGFKAWANEQLGREFFDLSNADTNRIVKKIATALGKLNKLR